MKCSDVVHDSVVQVQSRPKAVLGSFGGGPRQPTQPASALQATRETVTGCVGDAVEQMSANPTNEPVFE